MISIVKLENPEVEDNGDTSHDHGLEVNTVKIAMLPKAIYKFNVILMKNPITF